MHLVKAADLLRWLERATTILNRQLEGQGGHAKHGDPKAFKGISGYNLSGTVTLRLYGRWDNVVVEQELGPGTGYLIGGKAVSDYKHELTSPQGEARFVILTRYIAKSLHEKIQRAAEAAV